MTAKFLTPLRVEKTGARQWRLLEDLRFQSVRYPGIFIAPAGFSTDFASIPRLMWRVIPKVDVYDPVAVIHDAGYWNALVTPNGTRIYTIKRVADDLFEEGLEAVGVGTIRRFFMVQAVRRFGNTQGRPAGQEGQP